MTFWIFVSLCARGGKYCTKWKWHSVLRTMKEPAHHTLIISVKNQLLRRLAQFHWLKCKVWSRQSGALFVLIRSLLLISLSELNILNFDPGCMTPKFWLPHWCLESSILLLNTSAFCLPSTVPYLSYELQVDSLQLSDTWTSQGCGLDWGHWTPLVSVLLIGWAVWCLSVSGSRV
jgi:hypothetical protein